MITDQEQRGDKWLEIGTIVAPQGLKGELRVKANSDFPERFCQPGQRWLQENKYNSPQSVELLKGYQIPGKNVYVIQLKGIDNREAAELLRGAKLLVPESDRPYLEEDEFHVSDLINLEVYHQLTQEKIGVVINVFSAGNDLLQVKLDQQGDNSEQEMNETITQSPGITKVNRISKIKKIKPKKSKLATILIPFVKEIVPVIDLQKGILEINPPFGLLDLNHS